MLEFRKFKTPKKVKMDNSRFSSRHSQTAQVNSLKQENTKLRRELQDLKKVDSAKTNIALKEERSKAQLESKVKSLTSQLKQKNEIINSLQSRLQDSFNENKSDGASHAKSRDTLMLENKQKAKDTSTERLTKEINAEAHVTNSLHIGIQNLREELAQTVDEKEIIMTKYRKFVREQTIKQNIVSETLKDLVQGFNCLRNDFLAVKRNTQNDLENLSTELKVNLFFKLENAVKTYLHHSDLLANVTVEKPVERFGRLQVSSRNASKKDAKNIYRHGKTSTVAGRIEDTVVRNEEMKHKIKELEASLVDAKKDLGILILSFEEKEAVCSRLYEEIDVQRQELDRLDRANSMQSKLIEEHMQSERQLHARITELNFQLAQNKNNNAFVSQTPTTTECPFRTNQLGTFQLKKTALIAKDKLKRREADFDITFENNTACKRDLNRQSQLEIDKEKRKQVDDIDGRSKILRQTADDLNRRFCQPSGGQEKVEQKHLEDENNKKELRACMTSLQFSEKKFTTHCEILPDKNKEERLSSIWRIKELEKQLHELKSSHSKCLISASSFQSKEKEYKTEIQNLHNQVFCLNERAESLKCELTQALQEVTEKSQTLQEREIRLAVLYKEKERYDNDVTHLTSALKESKRLQEAKDQQLTCLGQMAKEWKMKLQELEYSQESKLKQKKEIHITDLEMFARETQKGLSEANEKLDQERFLHAKEADESKHRIETMKKINEDLQNKNHNLSKLLENQVAESEVQKDLFESLKEQESKTQNRIKYLQEKNRQLQSKENEYSLLISSSESTEVKLKEKIHQQEKQLNSDKEKLSNLQHQLEQALGELSECKDKIKERDVSLLECQQKHAKESEVLRQDTNELVKTLQEDNIVKESELISERNQHAKSIDTWQEKLSKADEKLNQQYYEHVQKTEQLEARIKSLQSSEAKLQSHNKILHDGNKEQENKLKSENTELRENLARLTDNVKYFETYIKDLQSRRSESEVLIKSFQSKEADFSFKLQDLKDQLMEEKNNASRFEAQADQAVKETNEYKTKLCDVETRLCAINEENIRYRNENVRLKSELDQCQRANATTEKQNLNLQEKKKALQVKIKEHKQAIESEQCQEQSNHARELELLQAEMTKKLTKVNKELNEERLQHSKVVKKLENCIKTDQHTNEKLKNETQRLSQLQNERDQIQQESFSYKNKIKELESQIQQLQSKEEECKLLLMSSQSTVVDYKTKIHVLEEQLDDQKETVRKLKIDIEQLMNQASEKQDVINHKESRVQKLSSELKIVENTKTAELENIKHRFHNLKVEFEAKDREYKNLHGHAQALEEKLFKLNRDKERESHKKDKENELTKKSLHDDMQRQIKINEKKHKEEKESFQSNINDLQSRNKELQDDYDACRRNLRCVTDDFEDYQMETKETIRSYQREITVLEAKTNESKYQKKCADQEQRIAALKKENEEMKTNHKNDFDRFKREILKAKREEMQKEKEAFQKKNEALMEKLKTVEAEKEMNENRARNIVKRDDSEELQKVRQELDEAKTRLSKLMGQKLTDNNPNITDLSDQNRPTKLAERYTELYDNQWTDAFEVLDDGHEFQTIQRLMTILYDAMKYCRKESEKQMKTLMSVVVMTTSQGDTGVSSAVQKQLKDCRKASAEKAVKHLYKSYQSQLSDDANRVPDYAKECFELCWFMSIQDPPVVLGSEPQSGSRFQTELYRAYTKSGSTVDYLVWPTLYLHEGGSILSKGVAQGR